MDKVCPACGMYGVEKTILTGGIYQTLAVCQPCRHAHPVPHAPLFSVSDASEVGKTRAALAALALDCDFAWQRTPGIGWCFIAA